MLTKAEKPKLDTYGPVLERHDEEGAQDQDTPDDEIRQDPCR